MENYHLYVYTQALEKQELGPHTKVGNPQGYKTLAAAQEDWQPGQAIVHIYPGGFKVVKVYEPKKMTLAEAKKVAAKFGCSLRKVDGEYRVNHLFGKEATAYYTTDLEDALDTAQALENNLVNDDEK